MSDRTFLDTNILVYAYTLDDPRNETATGLLARGGIVSVQVLNEFVDVARRRLRFEWAEIDVALSDVDRLLGRPMPLTLELHREAFALASRRGYRIYDSLVIAAARAAGCRILFSEDMRDGQTIDGVTIVNPFAAVA